LKVNGAAVSPFKANGLFRKTTPLLPKDHSSVTQRPLLCYPKLLSYKFCVNVLSILFESMVGQWDISLSVDMIGSCVVDHGAKLNCRQNL